VWVVHHGLGKHPTVQVFDSLGNGPYEADVEHVSDNELVLTLHSGGFSGVAYCN
jgi:hypothetical protein